DLNRWALAKPRLSMQGKAPLLLQSGYCSRVQSSKSGFRIRSDLQHEQDDRVDARFVFRVGVRKVPAHDLLLLAGLPPRTATQPDEHDKADSPPVVDRRAKSHGDQAGVDRMPRQRVGARLNQLMVLLERHL